jgi:hypothetical protein
VARRHFATDIITRKKWMQVIGGQLYLRILMNFVKVTIVVKKLED